jgi:hypothetical protein
MGSSRKGNMQQPPRAFTAEDADQRIPVLLMLIMTGVRMEFAARRLPVRIHMNERTHTAIAAFMVVDTIDKLFGLAVCVDNGDDAQPFTIESESGSRSHA